MAKVKTPLLGFGAQGTIGDQIVFAEWKGVRYARQHTVPTNPKTTSQTTVRNAFAWINDCYRFLPSNLVAIWKATVAGRPETDRNAFVRYNMPALRSADTIADIIISPGTGNAPALADMTAQTGSQPRQINVTATMPELPTGWTAVKVIWFALADQDPHDVFINDQAIAEDATPPYSATMTVPTANKQYVIAGIPVFTNAKNKTVYGPAVNALALSGT